MRRTILICFLAAGCGLPEIDTPAARAETRTDYPRLIPRAEILSRVVPDGAAPAVADLRTRGREVGMRGEAARRQGGTDATGLLANASDLRTRAGGIRDLGTPNIPDPAALRERAAEIRAAREQAPDAEAEDPAAMTEAEAERLRRLRLLRDGADADPL